MKFVIYSHKTVENKCVEQNGKQYRPVYFANSLITWHKYIIKNRYLPNMLTVEDTILFVVIGNNFLLA